MVRVKQRYLLVNILYPETSTGDSKTPPLVTLNQPTTDDLTPGILKRAISSEIKSLFGVYGAGSVSRSLLSEGLGYDEGRAPRLLLTMCQSSICPTQPRPSSSESIASNSASFGQP